MYGSTIYPMPIVYDGKSIFPNTHVTKWRTHDKKYDPFLVGLVYYHSLLTAARHDCYELPLTSHC